MTKSIHTDHYKTFLDMLRSARKERTTQVELAQLLGTTQSLLSKMESGERRLDIIETRNICKALGLDFSQFISVLERSLVKHDGAKRRK